MGPIIFPLPMRIYSVIWTCVSIASIKGVRGWKWQMWQKWQIVKPKDDNSGMAGRVGPHQPGPSNPSVIRSRPRIPGYASVTVPPCVRNIFDCDEMLKNLSAVASNSRLCWPLRGAFRAWQPIRSCKSQACWLSSSANGRQEKRVERGDDEGDMQDERTDHRYSHSWSILLNPSSTSVYTSASLSLVREETRLIRLSLVQTPALSKSSVFPRNVSSLE